MTVKNAFYAQSGGVTAVINATACGLIETARKQANRIGKVYAGRNGIIGALTEDLIDTSRESTRNIAALRHTPAGAFGSCRYKLKGLKENKREYERLIEVLRRMTSAIFSIMAAAIPPTPASRYPSCPSAWAIPFRPSTSPRPLTTTCPSRTTAPVSVPWRNTLPLPP